MSALGCPSRSEPLWDGDPVRVCRLFAHKGSIHFDRRGFWRGVAPGSAEALALAAAAGAAL